MMTPIRTGIVTISDSRSSADDFSGSLLQDLLQECGAEVAERLIVTDDLSLIRDVLLTLTERKDIDLVITTGGTGFGPRDNTPEATQAVIEREAPGIAEALRRETAQSTPMAMLSRGICGIRTGTLIINLPGSTKAVDECFRVIEPVLKHAIALIRGKTAH